MERPIVGISMGDPFGNGPEITVMALNDPEVYKTCRPLVVGDRSCMEYALAVSRKVNGIDLKLNLVESPAQGRYEYGTIDLIDLGIVPKDKIPDTLAEDPPKAFDVGPCALGGEAAFQYVVKVIDLAMKKEIQATVTNALSKEAINMAGHHYSGHTEIYAEYTGTKKYAMMLAHHDFRVVHVSTHVSLREACDRVKKARVLEVIEIADQVCRDMGIEHPKVAVAGLNPHCGENGLFGREEIEEIKPAIDAAKGGAPWSTEDMVASIESVLIQADTLDELAEKCGINAENLQKTIERYNELCAAGEDTDFGKSASALLPLEEGPYYAVQESGTCLVTVNGLRTDADSHVLDNAGNVIEGLYALGNTSGSMFFGTYPHHLSAISHGRCLTFGYLLGRELAGVEE